MFNSVQYIRDLCRSRGIPVSKLEQDCGFSNGYLNPKKATTIPYDRAKKVASYLQIDVYDILGETEKPTADSSSGRISGIGLSPQEQTLLSCFRELNEEGAEKAIVFIQDLIASGNYKKCNSARLVEKPKAV